MKIEVVIINPVYTSKKKHKVTMPETVNPDLENERRKCTFDVEELARYWIGDQAELEEKRARGELSLEKKISKKRIKNKLTCNTLPRIHQNTTD